jgi:hypothetical protein
MGGRLLHLQLLLCAWMRICAIFVFLKCDVIGAFRAADERMCAAQEDICEVRRMLDSTGRRLADASARADIARYEAFSA